MSKNNNEEKSNWGCGAIISFLIIGLINAYMMSQVGEKEGLIGNLVIIIASFTLSYFVVNFFVNTSSDSNEKVTDNQATQEKQIQYSTSITKESKTDQSIDKLENTDDKLYAIPNLIGVRDLKEDERLFYELIKSFNRENDGVFFDSKYSYRGDEYDKFVSMIFDYFSPISENIAKFLIVDLVKNTDIDPNTIFNRWVFINLIIKNHFGWYLRTHPDILALTTLSAKEFKEESGTYDALFHRNPDTKEFYLTMENYEVKADSSFVKYAVLNSIEENHKKIPYFQYFEDFEGNYYWEVRMEDSLAPQTSIQEWKNDGILK